MHSPVIYRRVFDFYSRMGWSNPLFTLYKSIKYKVAIATDKGYHFERRI
ncbi:MAG: hypothetical protein PWQ70_2089 [Clostridiales bacterium]|nr:hypothetical protein [Clostridiales bacterium]